MNASQTQELLIQLAMLTDRVIDLERRAGILPPEYAAALKKSPGQIIHLPVGHKTAKGGDHVR